MKDHAQQYISDELAHFIGRKCVEDKGKQYELLKNILTEEWLTHPPHNKNVYGNLEIKKGAKISQNEMYCTQMICFCDIPKQDLSIHIRKYGYFGLSFDKNFIIGNGGCPVLYIPKQSKVRSKLREDIPSQKTYAIYIKDGPNAIWDQIDKAEYFEQMMREYHDFFLYINPESEDFQQKVKIFSFLNFQIFNHIVFFDSPLKDNDPNNYYFEREWRMNGHLKFSIKDIKTIFIPKEYIDKFSNDFPNHLDKLFFID